MKSLEKMKEYLRKEDAEYLLRFYDELSEKEKEDLFKQVEHIDFKLMKELYNSRNVPPIKNKKIENISHEVLEKIPQAEREKYYKRGEELLKNNKVAVCQMAGGQGTRLGYDGPKGTFLVNLKEPKTIFEIFADKLKESCKKYNVSIPWYIMTSRENNAETVKFFKQHNYFEYGKENIRFFMQRELPLLDYDGNFIFANESKIFMAANGNGGIYEALHRENILKEMEDKQIDYLAIGNVDNILMDMLEPTFIGMMDLKNKELAVKTVTKVSPEERVGVICKMDGKPGVVEYTEISEDMANMRDKEGNLKFGEAYFGFVMFKRGLLNKIVKDLAYRPARKKNSYIDKNGNYITSDEPNTYKFEMFIFDGFEMADDMLALSVKREENFAPIKNKEGVDSPATAIELYNNYYNKKD